MDDAEGDSTPLFEKTYDELYELARERDIDGRTNMDKDELLEALKALQ